MALVLAVVVISPILALSLIIFSGESVHRAALERLLESTLDRPVEIAGNVVLSLSLSPKLSISDLIVGELSEGEPRDEARPPFLLLGNGEFQIDLRHLFSGDVVIPRLALSDLRVNLRRDEKGDFNWLQADDDEAWEVGGEDETLVIPLIVELSLERVRVLYIDEIEDQQAELILTSLTKVKLPDSAESLLKGKGEINEEPFELRGRLATLEALLGSRESFPLELDAAFPSMDIKLSGVANPWGEETKSDLVLEVSIYTLRGLSQNLAIPLEFDGVLQATGRLTGPLQQPTLSEIDVAVSLEDGGGLDLEGEIGDLINLQGLDLEISASVPENFVVRDLIPLNLPELAISKFEGRIKGDLPEVILEDIRLDIRGGTGEQLSLAGNLSADLTEAEPQVRQGNFTLSLQLEDSKSLANLLSTDLPRTGAMTLETELEVVQDTITVKGLAIETVGLGGVSLQGDGEIDKVDIYDDDLLSNLTPDLNLHIEVGDGAQFFEAFGWVTPRLGAFSASLGLTGTKQRYRLEVLSAKLDGKGDLAAELSGEIGELSFTPEFSANELDLNISAYSPATLPFSRWAGLGLPEFGATRLKANLTGSDKEPRLNKIEISIGEGGPIPLTAMGKADGIDYLAEPPRLKGVDLALSIKGSNPKPIFEHYGIDMPYFGVFEGTARLIDHNEQLSLSDLKLNATTRTGQTLKITGDVDDLIATAGFRLTADYTGALAQVLGLEPADALGEIRASVVLSDRDGSIGLEDIKIQAHQDGLYDAELSGDLDDLLERDEVTLAMEADVLDAQQLAALFEVELPPFARFNFEGDVSGGVQSLRGNGEFTLGSSKLSGVLSGGWDGPTPLFTGRLTSPLIDLQDFGLLEEGSGESDLQAEDEPLQKIFKSDPLPFEFLSTFDLDFEIDIDEFVAGLITIDRVTAKASLKEGALTLDPLNFQFAGGTVVNTLRINAAEAPAKIGLTSNVGDLDIETIFSKLGAEVPLDGELDLHVDLTAIGQSPKDLAESLTGTCELAMSRGRILLGSFNLTTVDVFSWLFSSEAQQGYSEITCFILRFDAKDGFAISEAVVLDTPSVRSGGQGEIDLHSEQLNILFDPEPKQRRLIQFTTPFAIRGPLNAPSVEVNPASATANALGGIIFSPLNALGSFFTAVSNNGRDEDNPCLAE